MKKGEMSCGAMMKKMKGMQGGMKGMQGDMKGMQGGMKGMQGDMKGMGKQKGPEEITVDDKTAAGE